METGSFPFNKTSSSITFFNFGLQENRHDRWESGSGLQTLPRATATPTGACCGLYIPDSSFGTSTRRGGGRVSLAAAETAVRVNIVERYFFGSWKNHLLQWLYPNFTHENKPVTKFSNTFSRLNAHTLQVFFWVWKSKSFVTENHSHLHKAWFRKFHDRYEFPPIPCVVCSMQWKVTKNHRNFTIERPLNIGDGNRDFWYKIAELEHHLLELKHIILR